MKSSSASQILAAQRKAKKSKAIERAYKKPIQRRPAPKTTEALRQQQSYGEQYTPEQIDEESRKFWGYYSDLVYCHNINANRASFERLIFCIRYICMMWGLYQEKQRSYWLDTLDAATAALDNEITTREQSPNERRAIRAQRIKLHHLWRVSTGKQKNRRHHLLPSSRRRSPRPSS